MDKETRAKWERALKRKFIHDAKMREIKDSVYRAPSVVSRNNVLALSVIERNENIANDPEYADEIDAR